MGKRLGSREDFRKTVAFFSSPAIEYAPDAAPACRYNE
jgi:hypothetical protein